MKKFIKLNSSNHITLHKTEDKMYTRKEVIKILALRQLHETIYDLKLKECVEDSKKWFEQNVK